MPVQQSLSSLHELLRQEAHHDPGTSSRGNCAWIVLELGGTVKIVVLDSYYLEE